MGKKIMVKNYQLSGRNNDLKKKRSGQEMSEKNW